SRTYGRIIAAVWKPVNGGRPRPQQRVSGLGLLAVPALEPFHPPTPDGPLPRPRVVGVALGTDLHPDGTGMGRTRLEGVAARARDGDPMVFRMDPRLHMRSEERRVGKECRSGWARCA